MAGVAGLEPVTSAVTGQRSNQLSYTPALGDWNLEKPKARVKPNRAEAKNVRAADAKEVGVGNPAEETYCYPNGTIIGLARLLSIGGKKHFLHFFRVCFQVSWRGYCDHPTSLRTKKFSPDSRRLGR